MKISCRFCLSFAVVAASLISTPVSAVDIDWSFGIIQDPIIVKARSTDRDDVLKFIYGPGTHNVYQFPDKEAWLACDFTDAVEICGTDVTECVIKPLDIGKFWYGCSLPEHCSTGNMKVRVRVNPTVTIDWSFGVTQKVVRIRRGATVLFRYGTGRHNVFFFPSRNKFNKCNFKGARLVCDRTRRNDCILRFNKQGKFRFGCKRPGHCSKGDMKVQIVVPP